MKKKKMTELPQPVFYDGRTCFGIAYFKTEDDAERFAEDVTSRGRTYNGGFFHGKPCGREKSFDFVHPEHGQLFAVTT